MRVMKVASIISGVVFFIYAILLLVQIWAESMSWSTFFKLSLTAGIIIIVTFGLAMLYREYIQESQMKKDKYID
jgi:membrane protein implicated in regulation of membrane protease activity